MQIILLLLYIPHAPSLQETKKRKRDRKRDVVEKSAVSPSENPQAALELILDRLVVWQAVADLGLDLGDKSQDKGKGKENESGVTSMLRQFWEDIIVVQ